LLWVSVVATAAAVEGVDYRRLAKPVADGVPERIEVIVLFRYGCRICQTVAPALAAFAGQLPPDVNLSYVPVINGESDLGPARLHYTLEALGAAERLRMTVYRDLQDPKLRLNANDREAVFAWAARQPGLDAAAFAKVWTSFGVESRLPQARQRTLRYPGSGLPAVFVDGRFLVEPGSWPPLMRDERPGYPRFRALMNDVIGMARQTAEPRI
jgi:thiol:disulfide interchange protein DsbA